MKKQDVKVSKYSKVKGIVFILIFIAIGIGGFISIKYKENNSKDFKKIEKEVTQSINNQIDALNNHDVDKMKHTLYSQYSDETNENIAKSFKNYPNLKMKLSSLKKLTIADDKKSCTVEAFGKGTNDGVNVDLEFKAYFKLIDGQWVMYKTE